MTHQETKNAPMQNFCGTKVAENNKKAPFRSKTIAIKSKKDDFLNTNAQQNSACSILNGQTTNVAMRVSSQKSRKHSR
jgi:hypothetical protein